MTAIPLRFTIFLLLGLWTAVVSPSVPGEAPNYFALMSDAVIEVDGFDSPGEWESAAWSETFDPLRADVRDNIVAFKILYDSRQIYLLIRGTSPPPQAVVTEGDQPDVAGHPMTSGSYEDVTIYWDPRGGEAALNSAGEPGHFQFSIALQEGVRRSDPPLPVLYSAMRYRRTAGRRETGGEGWFPAGAQVGVQIRAEGFQVEAAIPFTEMNEAFGRAIGDPPRAAERLDVRRAPNPGAVWGLQIVHRQGNGAQWAWTAEGTGERPVRPLALQRPFGRLVFRGSLDASISANREVRSLEPDAETAFNPSPFLPSTFAARAHSAPETGAGAAVLLAETWEEAVREAVRMQRPVLILYDHSGARRAAAREDYLSALGGRVDLLQQPTVFLNLHELPVGLSTFGLRQQPAAALVSPAGRLIWKRAGWPSPHELAEVLRATYATGDD